MNEREYYQYMYMNWINERADNVINIGREYGEILFKRNEEGDENEN